MPARGCARAARWLFWPAERFGINWLTVKQGKIGVWITNQARFTNGTQR
jgi:hypothetical protein